MACPSGGGDGPVWDYLGPKGVKDQWMGRITAIAVHPEDSSTLWAGAAPGGLFRSTDDGEHWKSLTDDLRIPGKGVRDIAVDPKNPDHLYIGTAMNRGGRDTYGAGVLKSEDGGDSWERTGLSFQPKEKKNVWRVVVDPDQPRIIYAAVDHVLHRSTDQGATWEAILTLDTPPTEQGQVRHRRIQDIAFRPGDPRTLYVASDDRNADDGGGVVFRTEQARRASDITDWEDITPEEVHTNRFALSVSPADPEGLYLAGRDIPSKGSQKFVIMRYDELGERWRMQLRKRPFDRYGGVFGGTGFWRLGFEVSPTDTGVKYVGGFQVDKIVNGQVWHQHRDLHVDVRAMEMVSGSPVGKKGKRDELVLGNDGGVSRTRNGSDWQNINGAGLHCTEVFGVEVRDDTSVIAAGTQDNNLYLYGRGDWVRRGGGDAGDPVFDRNDGDSLVVPSWPGGSLRLMVNGAWKAWSGPGGLEKKMPVLFPSNGRVLTGGKEVYEFRPKENTWHPVSSFREMGIGQTVGELELGEKREALLYVGMNGALWGGELEGRLFRTPDRGEHWEDITPGLKGVKWAAISAIESDPVNPDRVWVAFDRFWAGHRVYFSPDGGQNWASVSEGLPGIPVHDLLYLSGSDDVLFAATDVGVFRRAGEGSWRCFSRGFPATRVTDLEYAKGTRQLIASTYGRGLWSVKLEK